MPNNSVSTSSTPVQLEGYKASYSAATNMSTFAALATDIWQIIGSDTKVIKVNFIEITADATATQAFDFAVIKRTAVNTGGTSAAVVPTKLDSYDDAPTATVRIYSVNPTALGTGTILKADSQAIAAAGSTGYPYVPFQIPFGIHNNKAPTLRGSNESLTLNLQFAGAQAIPAGLSMYISVFWTEE